MTGDIIEATETTTHGRARMFVAWVDPVLMREALMDAFETLRLSGGRRPDAPYAWDRAELADELAPVLAGEMGRRVQ